MRVCTSRSHTCWVVLTITSLPTYSAISAFPDKVVSVAVPGDSMEQEAACRKGCRPAIVALALAD